MQLSRSSLVLLQLLAPPFISSFTEAAAAPRPLDTESSSSLLWLLLLFERLLPPLVVDCCLFWPFNRILFLFAIVRSGQVRSSLPLSVLLFRSWCWSRIYIYMGYFSLIRSNVLYQIYGHSISQKFVTFLFFIYFFILKTNRVKAKVYLNFSFENL